jgi:asparagine synthase (glutamine-hydrolysing)
MCGIAGIASRDPGALPEGHDRIRAMTDAIEHRGPDDDGHLVEPGIALGMRRLSIIDLPGGTQPLANEDGSVWTVFNGEIYNFPDLQRELAARGHTLASRGDTETIVHSYEEDGVEFPRRLRGMFAIAVWDRARRRLVLSRDRMGVKPLYYAEGPWGLAFASEVKSLIAGGLVDPALDPEAAELFLAYGYVPGPRTLFEGVRKLPPACTLVWEDGRLRERERGYWSPWEGSRRSAGASWQEDEERLLELLRESTRARMVSDVPLGVMLSGGLDSSLVCALMAEASTGPVETFSIGFAEDRGSNELADARAVANRLGTTHHELETSAVDHPDLLDEVLWHMEEPVAELSSLGFLLLSRLARESVTVALSGQGADELLGGYRKHQVAAAATRLSRLPRPVRGGLGSLGRLAPEGGTAQRGLSALAAADAAQRQLAMSRVLGPADRERLLTPGFRLDGAERAVAAPAARAVEDVPGLSILAATLEADRRLALVDNMFLYFDKASMAASLEVRVPFMDHDVVSFCSALPDSRRVFRMRRKELLRRIARGYVADEIIDKKKRGFFRSATGSWLRVHRDGLVRETLLDERTRRRGQLDVDALRPLVDRAGELGPKDDQKLLCLFLLERWQRFFVDVDGRGRLLAGQPVSAA